MTGFDRVRFWLNRDGPVKPGKVRPLEPLPTRGTPAMGAMRQA